MPILLGAGLSGEPPVSPVGPERGKSQPVGHIQPTEGLFLLAYVTIGAQVLNLLRKTDQNLPLEHT